MRAEVLKDLLSVLDECVADPAAVAEFRQLVQTVGLRHGVTLPVRDERIQFARQLLDSKRPRSEIRDRLMNRFSVGESQAYRDINDALQIVPKLP